MVSIAKELHVIITYDFFLGCQLLGNGINGVYRCCRFDHIIDQQRFPVVDQESAIGRRVRVCRRNGFAVKLGTCGRAINDVGCPFERAEFALKSPQKTAKGASVEVVVVRDEEGTSKRQTSAPSSR